LGTNLGSTLVIGGPESGPEPAGDDMGGALQAMEAIFKPLAPIFMGIQMGLVLGIVATQALSQYDLCLPRVHSPNVSVIDHNVNEVARQLNVAPDELRMWVTMHEVVHISQFSVDWVRRRLETLLEAYIDSIHFDPSELQQHLQTLDPQDPDSLRRLAEDSEGLLGRFISTDQPDVLESVETFISVLEGYGRHVVGIAATGILSDGPSIGEALERRSEEADNNDRLLEGLLGLRLTPELTAQGREFCASVIATSGIDMLNRMWETIETFPTREELSRPDEWIRRVSATPKGGMFAE
jgi:putative hydrolase